MLTQAIHAPTPIRIPAASGPAPSPTWYFVVIAHPQGDYIPESSLSELNRDCTISDIAGGQHEHVRMVIAMDRQTGRSWDASKDIATQVLNQCLDYEGTIPDCCRDFLEDVLGWHHVRQCEFEAAA